MADRSARRTHGEPLHPDDPTSIGRYEVIGRLGAGGMGRVYLALDSQGRQVAIKVIRSDLAIDPEFRDRFADEVAAARRVAPFCTAQVLDADPHARRPYLVTEFIDGARLDEVVAESGPLPLSTLQGVAVGVASALTAIHGAGIVHRDLKPSNVLLSYSGPRVIDFGIARALDAVGGRTQSGLVLGSVGWMAPEQMEGTAPVGPATDIYAWGLLVAFAAAGEHPYGDGTYLEMSERMLLHEPDLRHVPAPLLDIVVAALQRDPRRRPSAEQLLLRLLGDRGREGGGSTRAVASEVLDNTWPRGRSAAAAAAGFGLGAPAGAAAAGAAAGDSAGAGARAGAEAGLPRTRLDGPPGGAGGAGPAGRPAPTRVAGPADAGNHWWEAPPGARQAPSPPRPPGPVGPQGPGGPQPARRRRKGGFVQYGDEPEPVRAGPDPWGYGGPPPGPVPAAAAPAPQRPAARPAPPPAPAAPYYGDPRQRPQGGERRPAAPPPAPPAPPTPAPYRPERRPRPRRRWRLRIPFKRTIIFVLLVLFLLSAADQIATMVDEQRQQIWNRIVTSVQDSVDNQVDRLRGGADDLREQVPDLGGQGADQNGQGADQNGAQDPASGDSSLPGRIEGLPDDLNDLLGSPNS
ncbi:serine/threonine protein kinase [Parafrankia colletiae]|uniref:Serine/threonine protein kinase n=1 Tax=Parafrankia colletiae TaxID=573497 RepID=A0A1S1R0D0_9ACTN|nr:serine/threonine-protein kinase [Parafrankia colletiae]MCK9899461.1 serine/threonine protein kinase [Frankia sp. Cpl3]OHV38792.1 serine/threonine protein kinase [Parafrankia colletiae]